MNHRLMNILTLGIYVENDREGQKQVYAKSERERRGGIRGQKQRERVEKNEKKRRKSNRGKAQNEKRMA